MTRYGLIADSGDKKRSPQCVYKLTLNDTENRVLCPLKVVDCALTVHQPAAFRISPIPHLQAEPKASQNEHSPKVSNTRQGP